MSSGRVRVNHTHGEMYVKHTSNDQNMLKMSKHGKPQSLVLIGVQIDEKNTIQVFYQTYRVHTLYMYDEKCMNMLKSSLITCYFATWGQHNQQEKSGTKPNQQN